MSKSALIKSAISGDSSACMQLFETFLSKSETIEKISYLGKRGFWGFGIDTFICISTHRIAWIEAGPFREIKFQETKIKGIEGIEVKKPSLLPIVGFILIGFILSLALVLNVGFLILDEPRDQSTLLFLNLILSALGVFAISFGVFNAVRLHYRLVKCGIIIHLKAKSRKYYIPSTRKHFFTAARICKTALDTI